MTPSIIAAALFSFLMAAVYKIGKINQKNKIDLADSIEKSKILKEKHEKIQKVHNKWANLKLDSVSKQLLDDKKKPDN